MEAGDQPLGWKLGFGAPASLERLGTTAPLPGYLMRSALAERDGDVAIGAWTNPVLEPEIAVHMAAALPSGSAEDAARNAVAGLGLAFELADLDPPPEDPEAILVRNVYQRGLVLASRVEGASPADLRAGVVRGGDGEQVVRDPQGATGDLLALVRHVADLLGAFGEGLRAGEVVICGSIVAPMPVAPGDAVEYELEPLGRLFVRLTA